MTEDMREIESVFKTFVEGTLIEHDAKKSLSVIAEDVIGIGMGNQGIVSGKPDLIRILNDGKVDADETVTTVAYEKIQIRCYKNLFGSICGVLKIRTEGNGRQVESSLGQMMGVRKENGRWWVYAVQATPLFNEIEEMEAYPIKFAENALEKYRQQEQIAKDAQKDSVAIYRVNLTDGIFENSVVKNDMVIATNEGDSYESTVFESARMYLSGEECYQFISTFSLGNIIKVYNSGQTELSMEYKMHRPGTEPVWMKTMLRLYMDKSDENLKGYLYVFDIDQEKRRKIELQDRVERDPMTELYNKKYAEIKIAQRLKNISAMDQGAFFMVDLDHFKDINDTYGHQKGDFVIKQTAKFMKEMIQADDIAGRVGGDEFCIYFHGRLSPEKIEVTAKDLCQKVRSVISSGEVRTSCSIGIVYCGSLGVTFEEVYKKADEALYCQKKCGRNGYTMVRIDS